MSDLALVHRGPATVPGCPEAVVELLERRGLTVRTVGPDGELPLDDATLAAAVLYAQPGGGTLAHGWRHLRRHRRRLRRFVHDGGCYLGFCLGGYLAGRTPGLGLFPGDTDRWIDAPGSHVDHDGDTVLTVAWRGRDRRVFFQDGPVFDLDPGADVEVLARYPDGGVAALVAPHGAGRVGLVGPHPEASADWFTDAGLRVPDDGPGLAIARDLADDLVAAVLDGRTASSCPR